jgi:hypothetical protein
VTSLVQLAVGQPVVGEESDGQIFRNILCYELAMAQSAKIKIKLKLKLKKRVQATLTILLFVTVDVDFQVVWS